MKIILVSTPIGHIGSGFGGGVEVTVTSLCKGLLNLGHDVILVAPQGSELPLADNRLEIRHVEGSDQPSWQHLDRSSPVLIPLDGVLPRLWEVALELGSSADAILNCSYDWLPIWITPYVKPRLFHLISMGGVSKVMESLINQVAKKLPIRFAFHSYKQAADYQLSNQIVVVGNGFDLVNYEFKSNKKGPIGWAGRIAPEKGLEDAASVAAALGDRLLVWGLVEDSNYASQVEKCVSAGTIDWRGFLPTAQFQKQLGECRVLLNTPKWNEAYGNVLVEAMACGVPVVAYDRGGPGELIASGENGWLVPPDDVEAMKEAVLNISEIHREKCRDWVLKNASQEAFSKRVETWITEGLMHKDCLSINFKST